MLTNWTRTNLDASDSHIEVAVLVDFEAHRLYQIK
jgi:hypothetical protein